MMICKKCSIRRFGGLCDECDSKLDLISTCCEDEFTLIDEIDFTNEEVKEKIDRLINIFITLGLIDNNKKLLLHDKALLCINNLYLFDLLNNIISC